MGTPVAVTNNGRVEDPRTTGTAWAAVRNRDLATPITGMPNSGMRVRTQARPAAGVQVGVTIDHQQAQPAHTVQDRAQRRELAQVELTRPVGRHLGYHRGAFVQHARKGSIADQHGRRAGTAGVQVMHVHGCAHADFHILRMPEPAPGISTVFWPLPVPVCSKRPTRSRSVIGLRQARARVTA